MAAAEDEAARAVVADAVEDRRAVLADNVEQTREDRAERAEITRAELARILEEDRKAHNVRVAEDLKTRTQLINRRFGFLFLAGFLVFGLLAYRSEVNSNAIEDGFRQACEHRAAVAVEYNAANGDLPPLPVEACTGEEQP